MADFGWALEQLKAGKKVRRSLFPDGRYAYKDGWVVVLRQGTESLEDCLCDTDVFAEDWELCEEPKPKYVLGSFDSAMVALESGDNVKVRRGGWPGGWYITWVGPALLMHNEGGARWEHTFGRTDTWADDWEYA